MVGEARAYVQGESLKTRAALLIEAYQLPDLQGRKRTMRVLFVLLALGTVFVPCESRADMLGNDWKETCDDKAAFTKGLCLGEVLGEIEGISSGFIDQKLLIPFCIPPNRVTNGQLQDVIYKYVVDHPAERHFHLSLLVIEALIEAFPRRSKSEICN